MSDPYHEGGGHTQIDRRKLLLAGRSAFGLAGAGTMMTARLAMAQTSQTTETPIFTMGHYQQQLNELASTDLEVEGAVPAALSGHYFRNGHNPKPDLVPPYWFGGNGMIHGVRISGGRVE